MSRTHQLYHDLQQERIRSAALRLELYRVRQDKDALKTQLEAAQAEIEALSAPAFNGKQTSLIIHDDVLCTTPAQYEALSVRRAGVEL